MDTFRLLPSLAEDPALEAKNLALRQRTLRLDWSDVTAVTDAAIATLLEGLDLADDADLIGISSMSDAVALAVGEALERLDAGSRPSSPTTGFGASPSGPIATAGLASERAAPEVWRAPETTEEEESPAPPRPTTVLEAPPPEAIRRAVVDRVVRDLLGPAGGPEEEIDEPTVRERYLVGMLAPRRKRLQPELMDDALVESGSDSDDGTPDPESPRSASMFPSSVGFTFNASGEAMIVSARWGRYLRQPSATREDEHGAAPLIWKRAEMHGSRRIPLAAGRIEPFSPCAEQPEVRVEGVMRPYEDDFLVTLFLVNGQEEPEKLRDAAWVFQPVLSVEGVGGAASFVRRPLPPNGARVDPLTARDRAAMAMLYRHQVEFAVGHGVAVHAEVDRADPTRATRLETRAMPSYELLREEAPGVEDDPLLEGLVLDMKELAEAPRTGLVSRLQALPEAYAQWIARERAKTIDRHESAAREALDRAASALERIRDGLSVLATDEQAADAFRFANRAMWQQRVRSIYAARRRRGFTESIEAIDVPANRRWRTFQIAFILLNLPSVTNLYHPDRTHETDALADLLWFPTGGGKTEAYLGLAAYTMGLRRLQGMVGGRSGESGIAVLMRYTLRLLTLQQFQRATALICACETIRRESEERWGREPFRIGLWVGRNTTPNFTAQADEAIKQSHGHYSKTSRFSTVGTPAQLDSCPWCGTRIDPGKNIRVEKHEGGRGRTIIYCGDRLGRCAFSAKHARDEGLPVVVVDEEIYRRLPTMLIATVDKFAQLPWNGATQMLFGQVDGWCSRHGFRSPEIEDADTHRAFRDLPKAETIAVPPLRPPDLIIQDELHLISGPLGTLTGLYETAIDELCTWTVGGKRVRPKVIASTATIRRASEQVHNLFLRKVAVFPPHGTDARDNFFAIQRPTEVLPGRLYLGVCAPGRRMKAVQIRVYTAFLAAAQQLYEQYDAHADPWMTLVGYFSSMRELAGSRRLIEDDVRSRLKDTHRRGLARRRPPLIEELTSRRASAEIPQILDRMDVRFSAADERQRKETKVGRPPIDVLLATNMISVGVDVERLGLMVCLGQPKTTAEYIQATSRVGRRAPGIVCTIYNWARPRDLSHYETFEHYHATFYQHVEALSVTPFAARAVDRGLTALLVALVRHPEATFNANGRAQHIDPRHRVVTHAIERIVRRAENVSGSRSVGERVRRQLLARLDQWSSDASRTGMGSRLAYKAAKDGVTRGLLKPAGRGPWDDMTCLNSLRDVEPTVNLVFHDGGLDEDPPEGGAS